MAAHCSQWALSAKNSQWTVCLERAGALEDKTWYWSILREQRTHPFTTQVSSAQLGPHGDETIDAFRFRLQNSRIQTFNLSQRDTLQSYQSSQLRYFETGENALGAYSVQCMSFLHFLQQTYLTPCPREQPHAILPVARCTEGCKH